MKKKMKFGRFVSLSVVFAMVLSLFTVVPVVADAGVSWADVIASRYITGRGGATLVATAEGIAVSGRGEGEHSHNNGIAIDIYGLRALGGGTPEIVITGIVDDAGAAMLRMDMVGFHGNASIADNAFTFTLDAQSWNNNPPDDVTWGLYGRSLWGGYVPAIGSQGHWADGTNIVHDYTITGITVGGTCIRVLLADDNGGDDDATTAPDGDGDATTAPEDDATTAPEGDNYDDVAAWLQRIIELIEEMGLETAEQVIFVLQSVYWTDEMRDFLETYTQDEINLMILYQTSQLEWFIWFESLDEGVQALLIAFYGYTWDEIYFIINYALGGNGDGEAGQYGHVLRVTFGTAWAGLHVAGATVGGNYTVTLDVITDALGGVRIQSTDPWNPNVDVPVASGEWSRITATLEGAQSTAIQIAPLPEPRTGHAFYIDNLVITRADGTEVINADFEVAAIPAAITVSGDGSTITRVPLADVAVEPATTAPPVPEGDWVFDEYVYDEAGPFNVPAGTMYVLGRGVSPVGNPWGAGGTPIVLTHAESTRATNRYVIRAEITESGNPVQTIMSNSGSAHFAVTPVVDGSAILELILSADATVAPADAFDLIAIRNQDPVSGSQPFTITNITVRRYVPVS